MYVLRYDDVTTGEIHQYSYQLYQGDVYGWKHNAFSGSLRASDVTLTVCDNEALENGRTHTWKARQIGIDAIKVTCVAACNDIGVVHELPHLKASVHNVDTLKLTWSKPRDLAAEEHDIAGYRIQYFSDGWESPIYEMDEEYRYHYSPILQSHRLYTAKVWSVDVFGRSIHYKAVSILLDPAKLLEPDILDSYLYYPDDDVWITKDDIRAARDGLDGLGIVDPTYFSDGSSGVISLLIGDYTDSLWSVVAIIPYLGDVPKIRKAKAVLKRLTKAIDLASTGIGPAKKLKGVSKASSKKFYAASKYIPRAYQKIFETAILSNEMHMACDPCGWPIGGRKITRKQHTEKECSACDARSQKAGRRLRPFGSCWFPWFASNT